MAIGLVLAAALAVGLFVGVGAGPSSGGAPSVGAPVPSFSLPRLGGGAAVRVPTPGGGPAVLVFFASWCGPCQAEIPALAAAYRTQGANGSAPAVDLIGVDGSDPTPSALAFVHADKVGFAVGADSDYTVTQGKFGFTGLPEAVMVRADGTIAHITYGPLSVAELRTWERHLATPT